MKRNTIINYLTIILFALYPVLSLYSSNIEFIRFNEILSTILVTILATSFLFLLSKFLLKDWQKSTFFGFIFLIFFYSYGFLFQTISSVLKDASIDWDYFLLPLWGVLILVSFFLIKKYSKPLKNPLLFFNLFAVCLFIFPLVNIASYGLNKQSEDTSENLTVKSSAMATSTTSRPDIYYIILDGYARDDILEEYYSFDNSDFLEELTKIGFFVSKDSYSNYGLTFLSLASSLNMRYLDDIPEAVGIISTDRSIPYELINHPLIWELLKTYNYSFINLSSGWGPTDKLESASYNFRSGIVNDFNFVLLDKTIVAPILKRLISQDRRARINGNFRTLGNIASKYEPKFVLAHFLVPHPPFIFDKAGNPVETKDLSLYGKDVWEDKQGYRDQIQYVNTKTIEVITKILSESRIPPIIIIQADHGSASTGEWESVYNELLNGNLDLWKLPLVKERMSILNAYYVPSTIRESLYPEISPVNSFRIIIDFLFGNDMGKVEDLVYFSDYNHPYEFFPILK